MPGTVDAAIFDIASGQRSPHVRASVEDGRVVSLDEEHGHHATTHFVGAAFSLGNIPHTGDGLELGHACGIPSG